MLYLPVSWNGQISLINVIVGSEQMLPRAKTKGNSILLDCEL